MPGPERWTRREIEEYFTWSAGLPLRDDPRGGIYHGQTLGIDEECRAQRMIESEVWDEEEMR